MRGLEEPEPNEEETMADAPQVHTAIHMLDVGADPYGDAVLCQFGNTTVLIDGGHPGSFAGQGNHDSIPAQLEELLQREPPFTIDLLIISHAHQDHIGCIPRMVKEGVLRLKWALLIDPALGWGRVNIDQLDTAANYPEKVRKLAAALREHPRKAAPERINLTDFITDAVTLEDRYKTMIQTLKANDTRVVRFGRDSTDALINAFDNVGLRILGPTTAHLKACARLIAQSTQDALDSASDFLRIDATSDLESAYLKLLSSSQDSLDAASRLGAAVNLQSVVTMFEYRGKKHLFAGDMQFEDPEVSTQSIVNSVRSLREIVSQHAPYDSVKLSHHGSHNAFSEEIFNELGGTVLFGICAGETSTSHPSRQALKVLKDNRNDINWVRTDHNRRSSFFFGTGDPDILISQGHVNDFRPNSVDEQLTAPSPAAKPAAERMPQQSAPQETTAVQSGGHTDTVELIVRIPHKSTRVTFSGEFSVTVEPGAQQPATVERRIEPKKGEDKSQQPATMSSDRLTGLLLVTNRQRLASNVGQVESEEVLHELTAAGAALFDEIPDNINDAATVVGPLLSRNEGVKGVVLLGGYDVVPSQRFDCLPPDVRARVDTEEDPDNFIVWSDDVYGKRGGRGMPLIPVSRIPDGQSAKLLKAAISAGRPDFKTRGGVRNSARPFAEEVWRDLGGTQELLISEPTVPEGITKEHFSVDQIYLMLHGHHNDTARFWGESAGDYIEAFNIGNIPAVQGSIVFTGCCWGALTVNKTASRYSPDQPLAQKTPGSSVAMSFLEKGANAFVGCTGAHYSPDVEPYNFFGGPMHRAFWSKVSAGEPPAQALLNAKVDYLKEMPHGRRGLAAQAIEFKILWQYTCLGLGW